MRVHAIDLEQYWGKHKREDYPPEIIQQVEDAYDQARETTTSPSEEQVAEIAGLPGFIVGAILGMGTCDICGYTKVLEHGNNSSDPQDSYSWCSECEQRRQDLDDADESAWEEAGGPRRPRSFPGGYRGKGKRRVEAKDYMDMLDTAAEFLNGEYTPVRTGDSSPGVAWMVIHSGPYAGKEFMVWDDSLYDERTADRAKKLNMVYFNPSALGISIMEVPDIGTDTTDEQMALWDKHWPGWDRRRKSE